MDYVWHELNTTHKNGLKSLLASRDAAEAARNAFGWYEFSVGPEVAVADMNKHGQNGLLALNQGVQFALQLTGQPVPQMANLPSPQAPQVPQTPMSYAYEQPQVVIVPPLTPYNKEAFYGMENTSNNQALMDMVNSVQDQFNAYQQEVRQRELAQQEAAERQRGLAGLGAFFNMMGSINQGNDDTSPYSYMSKMLTMMPNTASRGGRLHRKNLYGGEDEPTGQMATSKPVYTNKVRQRPDGSYYYIDDNDNQWPEIGDNRYATYNTEGNISSIFNLNPSAVEAVKPSYLYDDPQKRYSVDVNRSTVRDLDLGFANMLTGGYASMAKSADESAKRGSYLSAAAKYLSPLMAHSIAANPLRFTGSAVLGGLYGEGTDWLSNKLTGNSWAANVSKFVLKKYSLNRHLSVRYLSFGFVLICCRGCVIQVSGKVIHGRAVNKNREQKLALYISCGK